MAYWAMWMFVAAAFTFVITSIGTWLIWRQVKLTRQAVEDTGDATKAMERQNEIAQNAQRPWLSACVQRISSFKPGTTHKGVNGFYVEITGKIENHGSSPATDIHTIVDLRIPRAGQSFEAVLEEFCQTWREKAFTGGPALFPGQNRSFNHHSFISQSDIDAALEQSGTFKMVNILVVGCITYRSARFDGPRQTKMMYYTASIENGVAKVIRPDVADWWQGDIRIIQPETILPD